jgi:hypothetical protein
MPSARWRRPEARHSTVPPLPDPPRLRDHHLPLERIVDEAVAAPLTEGRFAGVVLVARSRGSSLPNRRPSTSSARAISSRRPSTWPASPPPSTTAASSRPHCARKCSPHASRAAPASSSATAGSCAPATPAAASSTTAAPAPTRGNIRNKIPMLQDDRGGGIRPSAAAGRG